MTKHIPLQSTQRLWPWLALAAALGVTFGIYQVGLHGGFVYDDFGFIVGNASIKVSANTLQQWFAAAVSFPTGTYQGRWLGMLSFAANHYLTGMDPYWFKLTNLGIHLLNGVLLFLALRALFSFHHASHNGATARTGFDPGLAAAALASLWLVLPINLTAVLYISQRLESLSNTFVFLGLWWYLRARLALWQGRSGVIGLWLALLVGTGIGVLVKESAVLLPLYAFSVELALTGFRQRDGRWFWHWDPRFFDGPHPVSEERHLYEEERVDAVRNLRIPALLVRGGSSELVKEEHVKEFLALAPQAKFVDVAGARHMVAGDRNDVFSAAIVDFLSQLPE